MALKVVQLGTARAKDEGVRLGTVRRPPRGVRKEHYARENWYDVWLPNLAPSATLMKSTGILEGRTSWSAFDRKFSAELKTPDASHLLDALAALSHVSDFSVGCYCDDEARCHRSVLRRELAKRGARIAR